MRITAGTVLSVSIAVLVLLTGCASSERSTVQDERAVDAITEEDIQANPSGRLEDAIRGRVAGVHIVERPGGFRIYIRGISSIHGSNQPLYVIDGMPLQLGDDGFVHINPYDVASIRILKNPGDTGIYGVRGANGVVVIETKRGGNR